MAEHHFSSVGSIDVTMENTWPEVIDQVMDELSEEFGSFKMTDFECIVIESEDDEVYYWKAEGELI